METHYLLQTANHCKWPQRPEETVENYYQAWRNKNTLDYITEKNPKKKSKEIFLVLKQLDWKE